MQIEHWLRRTSIVSRVILAIDVAAMELCHALSPNFALIAGRGREFIRLEYS